MIEFFAGIFVGMILSIIIGACMIQGKYVIWYKDKGRYI